jgi:hypothetical protein
MLRESAARSQFFEREQHECVLAHPPTEIRPAITFAYITSWRIASEVLPPEWRQNKSSNSRRAASAPLNEIQERLSFACLPHLIDCARREVGNSQLSWCAAIPAV